MANNLRGRLRRDRLARLAEPLEPERPPWYEQRPPRPGWSSGWYWVAKGMEAPTYLGQGSIDAEITLRERLRQQGHEAGLST